MKPMILLSDKQLKQLKKMGLLPKKGIESRSWWHDLNKKEPQTLEEKIKQSIEDNLFS